MAKPTFMRVPKELLKDLKGCKIVKAESYADVVKRLIEKERKRFK
jgi:predicted CopG family antitoxin